VLTISLAAWETIRGGLDGLTALGKISVWTPVVALALVPFGALVAIRRWTELQRTSKILVLCWVGSIVLPLVVALLPLELLIELDQL
jgi:hypothetical protein